MHVIFFIIFLFVGYTHISAQNTIGLPEVKNYFREKYKSGAQNRQIKQDKTGCLYFANNDGLLTFNGNTWQTYPLPNRTIVRSIEFAPDGRLYAGGQDEFGYFSPNKNGLLEFHSLKNILPVKHRSFTDVWKIVFLDGSIFFQTSEKIYQISGSNCVVYSSTHWQFIGVHNNQLIVQDLSRGYLVLKNGSWSAFAKSSLLPEFLATDIIAIGKDSSLLSTQNDGIFLLVGSTVSKLTSTFLATLAKKNITSLTAVNDRHLAVSTNLAGCFIIDKNGNLIQSFARKEGLQNNNVLSTFLDKEKNLWLGLDNGIDFIAYNNAIKHINFDEENAGSGYAAQVFKNRLYLGTSTGLFNVALDTTTNLSFVKGYFKPVNNTAGQTWNLCTVNGKLLLGHNDGAFIIDEDRATLLDQTTGYWGFMPLTNFEPSSIIVAGSYRGVEFFGFEKDQIKKLGFHTVFESARYAVIDNNTIWVSHPYKGIFKIRFENGRPLVKKYTVRDGATSDNGNFIFKIKNSIILASTHGIFEFNASKNSFEPSKFYNNLFGNKQVRYLKEDTNGNVWFVFDKILGVIDHSGTKPKLIYFPELTDKFVSGFEFVYAINNQNVLIGGEKGFYHINYSIYKNLEYPILVQISLVKAFNEHDSLLFGGYTAEINIATPLNIKGNNHIQHSWNSFLFSFAAPVYAQQATIQYSYLLENFDEKWSEFAEKPEKEYTNLPAGSYTFKVKARNNLGNESPVSSYSFTVLPPWYQSIWAYIIYLILLVFAGYLLVLYQRQKFAAQQKRHEEEQKKVRYLHQLEMDKSEKELVKLRNEKLEAEIQLKNTELASASMHLVQKGELLVKVKDQMLKLKKTGDDETGNVKKIIKTITEEDKMDEQWAHFSVHFDKAHGDFLTILKRKFPTISNNEMKLCAYLRMNLSTKELAQLMNISVRGVEISRYRLRKKLGIPKEKNLFDFLLDATAD